MLGAAPLRVAVVVTTFEALLIIFRFIYVQSINTEERVDFESESMIDVKSYYDLMDCSFAL